MAQMNLLTGERKWIDAAEKLLVFVKTCHPQIFESTSNGKIAWGCAEIFSVTGDAGFRDTSARMAEWICDVQAEDGRWRSEEHTSELQSLMRISYAVFCLKKKIHITTHINRNITGNKANIYQRERTT